MKIKGFLVGATIASVVTYNIVKYFEPKEKESVDKFKSYYNMLSLWLESEEKGKPIDKLILEKGYKTIAIYGMGNIGNRLLRVLKDTEIKVEYVIDNYSVNSDKEIVMKSPDDILPEVDAIIVTVPFAFVEVKNKIEKRSGIPVVSMEHILFEV